MFSEFHTGYLCCQLGKRWHNGEAILASRTNHRDHPGHFKFEYWGHSKEREEMIASEKKRKEKRKKYIYKIYMWNGGMVLYLHKNNSRERERERHAVSGVE